MIKYLEKDNFDEEVKSGRILVDFYADWCGPCKMMGAVLETMDINILKVNVDEYPEIARRFGIMSIPTLIIFEDGKEVAKNIGFMSKEALTEFLKSTKLKLNDEVKTIFTENNIPVPNYSMSFYDLLKRPEIKISFLNQFVNIPFDEEITEELEIMIKYDGYIKKAYKECDINDTNYGVHTLRHTCATLLHKKGVDIKIIKEILGHVQINTTQIYTHIYNPKIKETMQIHPLSKFKMADALNYCESIA